MLGKHLVASDTVLKMSSACVEVRIDLYAVNVGVWGDSVKERPLEQRSLSISILQQIRGASRSSRGNTPGRSFFF